MSSSTGSGLEPSPLRRDESSILRERDRLVRHFMDRSSHREGLEFEMMDDRNASIGLSGTFRGPAIARRLYKKSRRDNKSRRSVDDLVEFFKLSVTSVLTDDGDDGLPANERTSLREPISEDKEVGNDELGFPIETSASGEISTSTKDESFANFVEIWIGNPISYLLFFAPFAVISHFHGWGPQWIFWLNFLTMVPLASILGDFTEEAALHTNDVVGGLLNASFGNAVEVVVAIQALMNNEIRVVQSSMIGSIFSNLLLVLGMCFFFGGLYHLPDQKFSSLQAMSGMGLLALSSIAMILPTPFASYWDVEDEAVLTISRVAAVFLLLSYLQLLWFQLYTHKDSFEAAETEENGDEDEEEEEATVSMSMALIGLGMTTGLVTIFSDYLVESIDGFCTESGISRTFVGLIILPIVGNAVEHITAVSVAMKNKMDLALGVAIGSSTQIALFVVPVTVIWGWFSNKPMTLNFPVYEISLYILSIFTVSICLGTGKSNWLLGSVLITTYIMLAIGFWFEEVEDF